MNTSFLSSLNQLSKIAFSFEKELIEKKIMLLKLLSKKLWANEKQFQHYHDLLLFLSSHPQNNQIKLLTEKEFKRITAFFRVENKFREKCINSGFPFTKTITRFSHDFSEWINQFKECKVTIESFEESSMDLNAMLGMTLPSLERDETNGYYSNEELLDALGIAKSSRFDFLLKQFSTLESKPFLKDYFWDLLKVWIEIEGKDKNFSRIYNRIPIKEIYYQTEILKKFDHEALLQKELPKPLKLNEESRRVLVDVIKKSYLLTMREIDPCTYMDETTLRIYELERGISVAIYGKKANRQLPMKSYFSFTLFKNGFPASYGVVWIFGKFSMFGINIFEAFRGGESGFILCQILRVFKQAFSIEYFEVESYMYGRGNPGGITSGAFWFYYRYGFRPVETTLKELAEKESIKIRSKPGYRSSHKTLFQFTESNMGLLFKGPKPISLLDIAPKVTKMMKTEFNGDRKQAIEFCQKDFCRKAQIKTPILEQELFGFEEISLLTYALKIEDKQKLSLLAEMIKTKSANPYLYNDLLRQVFQS
jgi:hypothetical protein